MALRNTNLAEVKHPKDLGYRAQRKEIVRDLKEMSAKDAAEMLGHMASNKPIGDPHEISRKVLGEILDMEECPVELKKTLLDSTSGTTGSVLIRQDLEPLVYRLFIEEFPAWDRIRKAPANGLVHASTIITSPDTGSVGSSFMSELGSVPFSTGTYTRGTWPISVIGNGRGVSLKELAAVSAGGSPYNPRELEQANAMVKLASDAQWALMQGNATNSAGTSSVEAGAYNALAFDGFRGPLGNVSAFSGNNATVIDIGSLNMLESLQNGAAKISNQGGKPTLCFMSINAKQLLDSEQQDNVRYNQDTTTIIPGLDANQFRYANGVVTICPVPGNSIGQYNRTSDSVLVEDIYLIDERNVCLRWLYSENFTVIQIPTGYDGILSDRVIIFGMWGLQQAAPVFNGKIRRAA